MMRIMAMFAASLLAAIAAQAEPPRPGPQPGDIYAVRMERNSSEESSDGSTGSSNDRNTIMERVIAVREDGLELEYDLPASATAQDRARTWQFPARVFRPHDGPLQLLNRSEMEARVEAWLKKAEWTREACGRWYFTWTAFQVECDPQSVIETIDYYDLSAPDLRDGAPYKDARALEPAPLARKGTNPNGATFTAEMKVDPEAVRRDRAKSDVVAAEIFGKVLTLDAALLARAAETVSGTITVTFDTDAAGQAWRRTTVARIEIKGSDRGLETQSVTETMVRRLVSRSNR